MHLLEKFSSQEASWGMDKDTGFSQPPTVLPYFQKFIL